MLWTLGESRRCPYHSPRMDSRSPTGTGPADVCRGTCTFLSRLGIHLTWTLTLRCWAFPGWALTLKCSMLAGSSTYGSIGAWAPWIFLGSSLLYYLRLSGKNDSLVASLQVPHRYFVSLHGQTYLDGRSSRGCATLKHSAIAGRNWANLRVPDMPGPR